MKKALTSAEIRNQEWVKDAMDKIDIGEYVSFWKKVICQAITDALSKNKSAKKNAIIWFLKDEKDFNLVCDWAQIVPHKLRQHIIEKLEEQDPNIFKNLLKENDEKTTTQKVSLVYKSVGEIKLTNQLNFLYNNQEIHAYSENNELWFDLTYLNYLFKFIDYKDVRLSDLDTYVDAINLGKAGYRKRVIFSNLKGLFQLSISLGNDKLRLFVDWMEKGMYKYDILKGINFFYLEFQGNNILAWLHKKRLFFRLSDVAKSFYSISQATRVKAQQKDKHYYVYLNSTKRQFMVRSDLLIQLIETRNFKKHKHIELKPQLIQWIKEQQLMFEGEDE